MKNLRNNLITLVVLLGLTVTSGFAQVYRTNDRQVQILLNRIDQRIDTYKYQLNRSLNVNNQDYINNAVADFETASNTLRQNFNYRRNVQSDVQDLLNKASYLNSIMRDNRFNVSAQNTWNLLRTDLSQLARYYNVAWNWNNNNYPGNNYPGNNNNYPGNNYPGNNNYPRNNSLTGTYRLNTSESEDVSTVINRSLINFPNTQRDRIRNNLERRLAVPEYLAIERRGNTVTLASSNADRTSFEANGRTTTETLPNGKVLNNTVTLSGNRLVINSDGDRVNAFYVTFEPDYSGEKLKVTRRLYLENRNQTIIVTSTYDKTSSVAQWNDVYRNGNVSYPDSNYGTFYIPNGTRLVAILDNNLSTDQTSEGSRFRLIVNQPAAYSGAVIEGTVDRVDRSGRLSGRAEMNLNFETIRLRNGQSYRFEGFIDRITAQNGDTINIDNEGAVKGSSQTKDTVVRSGIGAAIGAIIGGIAGGGSGAAVGAAIGAGAGSGSVLIQGRNDIRLNSGTTFEITSSSPANASLR